MIALIMGLGFLGAALPAQAAPVSDTQVVGHAPVKKYKKAKRVKVIKYRVKKRHIRIRPKIEWHHIHHYHRIFHTKHWLHKHHHHRRHFVHRHHHHKHDNHIIHNRCFNKHLHHLHEHHHKPKHHRHHGHHFEGMQGAQTAPRMDWNEGMDAGISAERRAVSASDRHCVPGHFYDEDGDDGFEEEDGFEDDDDLGGGAIGGPAGSAAQGSTITGVVHVAGKPVTLLPQLNAQVSGGSCPAGSTLVGGSWTVPLLSQGVPMAPIRSAASGTQWQMQFVNTGSLPTVVTVSSSCLAHS